MEPVTKNMDTDVNTLLQSSVNSICICPISEPMPAVSSTLYLDLTSHDSEPQCNLQLLNSNTTLQATEVMSIACKIRIAPLNSTGPLNSMHNSSVVPSVNIAFKIPVTNPSMTKDLQQGAYASIAAREKPKGEKKSDRRKRDMWNQKKSKEKENIPLEDRLMEQVMRNPDYLQSLRVVELKTILRDRELKVSGTKAELIQRIKDHYAHFVQ